MQFTDTVGSRRATKGLLNLCLLGNGESPKAWPAALSPCHAERMRSDDLRIGTRWNEIRKAVLQRDRYRCHVCGGQGATQVDHLVPVALGGGNTASNLRAVHSKCNYRKGDTAPAMPVPSRQW